MRTPCLAATLALLVLAGCRPEIGDECLSSIDCSAQGDRLCDTSQPDGYCTIFGCEPDQCPDNSVCVGFGLAIDPACTDVSGTDPRWPRFERSFCMLACESDDDCRDGYVCALPQQRRGESLDLESDLRASGVCFVTTEAPFDPPSTPPDSCTLSADEPK